MAVIGGTNIVDDGLTFAIDVLSENCYPGSGTTVTDLMGSKSGTLTNGPTIGTSPSKHINFDGSNDYLLYQNYIPTELTTDSYSLEFCVTNSFIPNAFNKLAATLDANCSPIFVTTGKPDHKASLQVV